jgi:hypothetical protein
MSFWSSIFGGSNPTLNQTMKQAGDTSDWATGQGKGLTTGAGNFFSTLMSGDPKKIASVLAPQISATQKQGQQQKQAMSQFGTRSGGTTAAGQTIDDKSRAAITDMIASLTGSAAGQAAQMGQGLIDTGLQALGQQATMSQQQMENWSNSIFGQALTKATVGG